jgi:hypothetical protein
VDTAEDLARVRAMLAREPADRAGDVAGWSGLKTAAGRP